MENKLLFIGAMGAGKTTAIDCLSDEPPVRTEAKNSNPGGKAKTTVAMDFGRIALNDDVDVQLYGIPGQERFDFVWPIVGKGAMGAILLADCSQPDWDSTMLVYLKQFSVLAERGRVIVALNRSCPDDISKAQEAVLSAGYVLPVTMTDPRVKSELLMAVELLIATLEMEGVLNG